jgi:hypothetical protein
VPQYAFVGRCQVEQVAHLAGGHRFDVAEGDHGHLLCGQPDDGLSDPVERLGGDQALGGLLLPGVRDIAPVAGQGAGPRVEALRRKRRLGFEESEASPATAPGSM